LSISSEFSNSETSFKEEKESIHKINHNLTKKNEKKGNKPIFGGMPSVLEFFTVISSVLALFNDTINN